ncbi:hypothetical protein BHM03_00045500 [Ensete ventricosum]|nr:hypothetical protein BHM03_00045500 [Ensete ventricosum]
MQWDLAGSSLGDSPKESGSLLGTRREIAGKKTGGLTVRLSKVARVYGNRDSTEDYRGSRKAYRDLGIGPSSNDEVGSRWKFAEGIGKLTGNMKGDRWEKDRRTCRKNVGGYRSMWDSDDAVGSRWKFARRFAKGIGKLAGNTKGDRRKEDQKIYRKIAGGCRSMRDRPSTGKSDLDKDDRGVRCTVVSDADLALEDLGTMQDCTPAQQRKPTTLKTVVRSILNR